MKKRSYEARIREVEHGSFTPLIFSAMGGMADKAHVFYKRLASLLSDEWNENYAAVMEWIRCCLSFSLLRLFEEILVFKWQFWTSCLSDISGIS